MTSRVIQPERVETFREIANGDVPAIARLWEYCNPFMAEMERARTAATIMTASGPDRNGIRGRCHVLLVGAEGTGKSEILDWLDDTRDDCFAAGPSDSEAGLKGNFAYTPPEPGALSIADGGILCVEELDKASRSERDALYEAMGKGHFTVNKGDMRDEKFDAEVRVIAAANDKSVFRDAFIDRFDFVVDVEEYGADATESIALTLLDNFVEGYVGDDPIDGTEFLHDYISWARSHNVGMGDGARDDIADAYHELIHGENLTGDIRQKESYLRTSYVISRLDRDDIDVEKFKLSVNLIHGEQVYDINKIPEGQE
jgi:DNA replicative helicase MCM subunit Mcm2 (Cdc46/Mcm family)